MSRPTSMRVDGTVYWTLMTYDADGILVDADSTPTVAVRKNGASVADAVTVTKRAATTGIYDCSHNPAGEVDGDTFGYEESIAISSQSYLNPWSLEVSSDVEAVKTVTDKIDTMLESDTSDISSGFESGFDGWTAVEYGGGSLSQTTVSTDVARTGSRSIKMVNDFANGSHDKVGIVRTVTLSGTPTISGYFYSTKTSAHVDQRILLYVDGSFVESQNPTAGQTWEHFSFPLSSGTHDIALVRDSDDNHTSGDVHLDDITITGVIGSDYQYTAGSLNQTPSGGGGGDATAANQTQLIADIAALNDFNPAVDPVANVTLVATTTTNSDMRGTDGANTVAPVDVSTDVTAVKAITDKLDTMLENDTSDIFSGFESGFDGWTAVEYGGGSLSQTTVSTDVARTGSRSIKIVNDFANGNNDRVGIIRTVTLAEGASISGYFYSTKTSAHPDQALILYVDGSFVEQQNPTAGQTWESFSFLLSSGTHDIALLRYSDDNNSSGEVHLDDITISGVIGSEYQYTASSLDQTPSGGGGGDATAANQTQLLADIAALNDFNPATDPVANVTLVATTTTNSDMRGTDGANTVAPVDVSSDVTAILADTADLQANQGQWLTATGFSTFDATTDAVTTDSASRTASQADVSLLATSASVSALNNITVQQVWDALTSGSYASGSFGERLLVGQTTDRSVAVSASNQVSADVYALQNNVITAAAVATDAVTELQTGLVTVGTGFTYTNGAGDYHVVTIS